MGGYGSGWHRGARQTVGDALTFSLSTLGAYLRAAEQAQATGRLGTSTRGTYAWSRGGEQTAQVGFSFLVEERRLEDRTGDEACLSPGLCGIALVLDYTASGEPVRVHVPLDTTATFRGRVRYWMRCPACGRRCGKLHLPGGACRFACRACHDLTYTSCQESGKYDSLYRRLGVELGTDPDEIERLLRRRGYL